jgi:hypothetical protein
VLAVVDVPPIDEVAVDGEGQVLDGEPLSEPCSNPLPVLVARLELPTPARVFLPVVVGDRFDFLIRLVRP